jgi:hypothetical protein
MSYLDFLVDALAGVGMSAVGRGFTSSDIQACWGDGFFDDEHKSGRMMRRDYGLVEFSFARRGRADAWVCTGGVIQVHRLARTADIVPQPVAERYGQFAAVVAFTVLLDAAQARGLALEPRPAPGANYDKFETVGKRSCVYVMNASAPDSEGMRSGDVWSIQM